MKVNTQTLERFQNFAHCAQQDLPSTKVIYSFPLLTGNPHVNKTVLDLRHRMEQWIQSSSRYDDPLKRSLLFQSNREFIYLADPAQLVTQTPGAFDNDGIHLSPLGKSMIIRNFRLRIHDLTRRILGKPRKSARAGAHIPRN